jgi:tight adherence protein B
VLGMINPIVVAGCLALGFGGLAFAFVSGDSRADKRRAAVAKTDAKALNASTSVDRTARKKQIADGVRDSETKGKRRRVSLATKIEQAGLSITKQQYWIGSALVGLACSALTYLQSRSLVLTLLVLVTATIGLPQLTLARLRVRRINKFISNFPTAIDIIVRGIKSGLPLGDTIRIAATESPEPVKSEFRRIVEALSIGMTLPESIERMAQRVPIAETNFFSIVISIQSKAGGNLSEALGNLSRVLRERKKMKGKINAMSMEAKASAAIIGAVPFLVVGALYVSSPHYISLLWTTNHGKIISVIAMCWMGIGMAMMKKMIAFDF